MSDTKLGIEDLLAGREVVAVCGPGGVGKTTVTAAAGLLAALHVGGRVLVLTVDPARRLATALGSSAPPPLLCWFRARKRKFLTK